MKNRNLVAIAVAGALFMGAGAANAGTINFTNCWSSCTTLGVDVGDSVGTVATLDFVNNGSNVDFTLTSLFTDYDPAATAVFLSELFFNTAVKPTSIINKSANIDSITYSLDLTNAGLKFDIDANFANKPADRILSGDIATWTFTNFSEDDVLTPAMVHFQGFANGGSVKIVDGSTIIENPREVPEPGILVLFGTALMGLGLSRKRKA